MKKYLEVPQKVNQFQYKMCDICGFVSDKPHSWNRAGDDTMIWKSITTADDVLIDKDYDICPDCFASKIEPVIKKQ